MLKGKRMNKMFAEQDDAPIEYQGRMYTPDTIGYEFLKWGDLPSWWTDRARNPSPAYNDVASCTEHEAEFQHMPKGDGTPIQLFDPQRLTFPLDTERKGNYLKTDDRWAHLAQHHSYRWEQEYDSIRLSTLQLALKAIDWRYPFSDRNNWTNGGGGCTGINHNKENNGIRATRDVNLESFGTIFWHTEAYERLLGINGMQPAHSYDWKYNWAGKRRGRQWKQAGEAVVTIEKHYTKEHLQTLILTGKWRTAITGEQELREFLKLAEEPAPLIQMTMF
jgi:hypothetical protein